MTNVSAKVVEKITTHILCSTTFFSKSRAVFYIMWKYIVKPGKPQMTIGRLRIACWLPRATNTHSEYEILIACPLQQWLHQRASTLRYTSTMYLHCQFCLCCFEQTHLIQQQRLTPISVYLFSDVTACE